MSEPVARRYQRHPVRATWIYYKRWGFDPLAVIGLYRVDQGGTLQAWTDAVPHWIAIAGALPENDTMIDRIAEGEAKTLIDGWGKEPMGPNDPARASLATVATGEA